MKYQLAKNAGFCFGVERTLSMVEESLDDIKKPIRMYGYLVHNEEVVKRLIKKGIEVADDLTNITKGTLIITAHGISPVLKKELAHRKNLELLDTTCPKVLNVQRLAMHLSQQNRKVLVFGDPNHKEVKGIVGAAPNNAVVFSSEKELDQLKVNNNQKYGLVVQTTKDFQKFKIIEQKIKQKIPNIKIFNTICDATIKRQTEARNLAKNNDLVLVIGSKTSSNTTRLYEISSEINSKTYFVGTKDDLKLDWFDDVKSVGITAGASAPDWVINPILEKIEKY